jgi:HD-GYP domain-containing protein (c-di-GMP phosphodiesterase class II)
MGPFLQDLDPFNRDLVALEQAYLAVLRKTRDAATLLNEPSLLRLLELVDACPYQAVTMARIKSGHTMTPRHGINVMMMARAWAVTSHRLGARLQPFTLAALFHDLGHWRPDDLLFVFDFFSREEYVSMQRHAVSGAESAPLGDEARSWIAQHHEQVDGRGYPEGISNPHPLAQLIRICDVYDALTTPRRFRPAYSAHRAMVMMSRWVGYKYDAGLFQSFLEFMGGIHPVGSMVRLRDGRMAAILPPRDKEIQALIVASAEGDSVESAEITALDPAEIAAEGQPWQQINLTDGWRALRPDLLSLPRFYSPDEP